MAHEALVAEANSFITRATARAVVQASAVFTSGAIESLFANARTQEASTLAEAIVQTRLDVTRLAAPAASTLAFVIHARAVPTAIVDASA